MKKLMKAVLVLTIAVIAITGCGKKESTTGSDSKKYVIAIVQPVEHPSLKQIQDTIVSELEALGVKDQVEIKLKNANGDTSLLPTIMQDLVSDKVDMIVPIATNTAQAAQAATTSIPIVFSAVSAPVEAGLVSSLTTTDQNITGVSDAVAIEDIFQLAKELTPNVKTFGFVYNTSEINSVTAIERAKKFCDSNGIAYKEATISATAELQQAAASLTGKVDAYFTPNDNTVASAMATYLQVTNEAKLPVYVGADSMVKDGGLATVGIDYTVLGKQTAAMIKRIMDGQSIKENPVEQIKEYAKMINTKNAKELNITIPDTLSKNFVTIE